MYDYGHINKFTVVVARYRTN